MAIGSEGVTPKNGKSWSDLDWNEDSTVAEEGYPYSKVSCNGLTTMGFTVFSLLLAWRGTV